MKEPTHNDNAPDISASIGEPVALYTANQGRKGDSSGKKGLTKSTCASGPLLRTACPSSLRVLFIGLVLLRDLHVMV
jgi:hypothetical protein